MGMERLKYFVNKVTRDDCKVSEGEEKVGRLPFTHKFLYLFVLAIDSVLI